VVTREFSDAFWEARRLSAGQDARLHGRPEARRYVGDAQIRPLSVAGWNSRVTRHGIAR